MSGKVQVRVYTLKIYFYFNQAGLVLCANAIDK